VTGLRQRRHDETKAAIVNASFTLFAEQGFAETTMEQIATAAGLSRSTLYRRFASKEDIVVEVPRRWLAAWDDAVEELDGAAPLAEALAAGCLAVAGEIDRDTENVLAAYQALRQSPALQNSTSASADWLERMVALVSRLEPDLAQFDTTAIAGAYLGAIDTMMIAWTEAGGKASVVGTTKRLLARLAPILP